MSHILRASFHQNPNIGLYGFTNDKFCLLAASTMSQDIINIQGVLKVPTHRINICGTSLVGAFLAGNNKSILVPYIAFDDEIAQLKEKNIPHHILETDYTALGNNLVASDQACLISPDLKPFTNEIKAALDVKKISVFQIGELPIIGSLMSLNDKGCLLSAFATEKDALFVEEFFGVPVTRGTINLGSPYIHSGIIANNNGFVFGERTGGPEAVAIDKALGFLT